MEGADRNRSARTAGLTPGALGLRGQAPASQEGAGGAAGQAGAAGGLRTGGGPGTGGRDSWSSRFMATRAGRAMTAGPVRRQLLVLAGFIVAGIAVTWPLATYLAGRLPSTRDTASYVWGFWWMAHQIVHLSYPWFTSHMAAPVGIQLGFHSLLPLPGLLLTPVTLLLGPSFSYNLIAVLTPGLLGYAMYRAARLWVPSATGAVAAGAFYGLSAMLTAMAWYRLNIGLGAIFLPMALEASVRLRRTPGLRQALILGLVMGAAVLTDQESAVLAAIVTGLTLLPWLVWRPSWAKLRPVALAVLAGTVLASPQIFAMAQELVLAHGGLAIKPALLAVSYKQYGIGLPGMFSPTPRVADFGLASLAGPFLHGRDNEGMPMFGTVLTVLALLGLIVSWRRRNAWLLAALWIGCAALALGSSLWIGKHQYIPLAMSWRGTRVSALMPFTWFIRIPGLSSFREADRLAILGLLPAALLAGAAVNWLRYHARPLLAVVLVLGILELGYSGNSKIAPMPTHYTLADSLIAADHSDSIVLDLPFGIRGGIPVYGAPFFPKALVMATADGHPRAIAYSSRVPLSVIQQMMNHAFYRNLVYVQHERPASCLWSPSDGRYLPGHQAQATGCQYPVGVTPLTPIVLPPAQLLAAARDASRLHFGWAVVWKRNISVDQYVLTYLKDTGFRYAYRDHNVLIYQYAGFRNRAQP
jgi:hypothetical protein